MRHILTFCIGTSLAAWAMPVRAGDQAGVVKSVAKVESVLGREVRTVRDEDGGRVIDLLLMTRARCGQPSSSSEASWG